MATVEEVRSLQSELETSWTKKMAEFQDRLNVASGSGSQDLAQLNSEFSTFRSLVTQMLALLRQQISLCTKTVDAIDMRQRRKILLLRGIPEDESDPEQTVLSILKDKLELKDVSSTSFKRCHRLGGQDSKQVRPILIQFASHQVKSKVWSSKAKLKGTSWILSEFLTHTRQIIHQKARSHFGYRNVWTLDGTIYIKVSSGGKHKVTTEEDLDSLIDQFPDSVGTKVQESSSSASSRQRDEGIKDSASEKRNEEIKRSRRPASRSKK